jgi:CheY-like chemotaxis protein
MKIMVVDDEPMLRLMYSDVLRDAGHSVLEARTADEGLSMLEDGHPIRVVVTDVHMPGTLDGFEFASEICRRWPSVGVVIVSGRLRPSKDELPDESLFLSKPVCPDILTETVEKACNLHN